MQLVRRLKHNHFFILFTALIVPFIIHIVQRYNTYLYQAPHAILATLVPSIMSESRPVQTPPRMPVYFLGIGGPNFIENTEHPAYSQLGSIGQEIKTKLNPKAIVVFSAHWQEGPSTLSINVAQKTDLIYDFFGFPPHFYEYEYPNRGSPDIAEKVIGKLNGAGIEVNRVKRGLDHGVWVGFAAGMSIPLLQSLCKDVYSDDGANSIRSEEKPTRCTDCTGLLIRQRGLRSTLPDGSSTSEPTGRRRPDHWSRNGRAQSLRLPGHERVRQDSTVSDIPSSPPTLLSPFYSRFVGTQ
jgi:hypothetical protein